MQNTHNPQRLAPTKLIDSTVDVEKRPAYKIIHLFFLNTTNDLQQNEINYFKKALMH